MTDVGKRAEYLFKENKSPRYPGNFIEIINELLLNKKCLCGRDLDPKNDKEECEYITAQMHRGTNTESSELYYDVKSSATTYAHFQLSEEDVITKAEVKLSSAIIAEQRAHQEFEDEGVINLDEFEEKEERNLGFEIDGVKDEETNTIKKIAKLDFELQQLQNEETKINKNLNQVVLKIIKF